MRARFLGKDPASQVDNSPTLFATDRTDRITYVAQGWKVTDPQTLSDIGPVPDHETRPPLPAGRGGKLTELIKPGPDFRLFFQTFEHTAFRLELRDWYNAPYENESVRKFLAGEPDDLEWMDTWLDLVRKERAEGRTFSRVRVVSIPLTDYSRFGLWASQFTVEAGEDIRYLARDAASGLPDHDYWMFDSRTVVCMHFDEQSIFLGGELIDDPASVVQHNYWRDAAWHRAVRREDFATE